MSDLTTDGDSEHPGFEVHWIDRGLEPRRPSDPAYPEGKHIDGSRADQPNCRVDLPYPAPRCGLYVIACRKCELSVIVTTAGRPDDPRSLVTPCNTGTAVHE